MNICAFGGLEESIWKSRIALRTKVRLYSTYVVPVYCTGGGRCYFSGQNYVDRIDQ